jgi:hypothetical protein
MRLSAHGLDVDVPPGWEARIMRRDVQAFGEHPAPVVHLANFPLPEQRGDFGAGVVEKMQDADLFVVMFEYGRESVGQPLFAHQGVPTLRASDFSARRLQRTIAGQAGAQQFFTVGRRAFCLYVVVGDGRRARQAATNVNTTVGKFGIVPR